MSSAMGQRVRNRQPEGGLIGLGGSPESGASTVRRVGSEPHQKRHMLRLWLKFPKPWPLSPEFPTYMAYKPSQDTRAHRIRALTPA